MLKVARCKSNQSAPHDPVGQRRPRLFAISLVAGRARIDWAVALKRVFLGPPNGLEAALLAKQAFQPTELLTKLVAQPCTSTRAQRSAQQARARD
jgi:hypothetical protein